MTITDRIEILYDHRTHGLQLDALTAKYGIQTNTIRHVLNTYREYGLVDANKYKRGGLGTANQISEPIVGEPEQVQAPPTSSILDCPRASGEDKVEEGPEDG